MTTSTGRCTKDAPPQSEFGYRSQDRASPDAPCTCHRCEKERVKAQWSEPVCNMDSKRCRDVAVCIGGELWTPIHNDGHRPGEAVYATLWRKREWSGYRSQDRASRDRHVAARIALEGLAKALHRFNSDMRSVQLGDLADMPPRDEGEEGPPPCMSCRTACTSGKDCSLWHEYARSVGDALLRDEEQSEKCEHGTICRRHFTRDKYQCIICDKEFVPAT